MHLHICPAVDSRRRFLWGLGAAALGGGWLSPAQAASPTSPVTVDGQTFPHQVQVGGAALVLNGVGLRAVRAMKVVVFKGYAAALYLPQPTNSAEAVLKLEREARRLQLRLFVGVSSEEFAKAFREGVNRNVAAEALPAMEPRVGQFEALVRGMGQMHKGDAVDLDWVPEEGMTLRYNGKVLGSPLPGADLYAALLAMFVGPKVRDPALKIGLLGGPMT